MKQNRLTVIIVIAFVIVGLAAAFGLLSFRAINSQTGRDSSIATGGGGAQPGQMKAAAATTALYVSGSDPLGKALAAELTRQLQQAPEFGQVQTLGASVDKAEYPLVYVEVSSQDVLWTPFYGRANLTINVAYAENGDISFRHTQPTEFHFENEAPSIKRSGKYTFTDVSWGVMSLPGYHEFLAYQVAQAILADLKG